MTAVAGWYGPRGTRSKLITRLTGVFKPRYCQLMNEFLADVYRPDAVLEMASLIEPAMQEDPAVSYDAWKESVAELNEFMLKHRDDAQALVDVECN
jgi:spore coat protein CotH